MKRLEKYIDEFLDKYDDSLNPIFVKEMRQFLSKKLFLGFVCFIVSLFGLSFLVIFFNPGLYKEIYFAREFFFTVFFLLEIICYILIPCFFLKKFMSDNASRKYELVYITTIGTLDVVKGRFWAIMSIVILILSLVAPYLFMLTYLPGVYLWEVAIALFVCLCCTSLIASVESAYIAESNTKSEYMVNFVLFIITSLSLSGFLHALTISRITNVFTDYEPYGIINIVACLVLVSFMMLIVSNCLMYYASIRTKVVSSNDIYCIRRPLTLLWFCGFLCALLGGISKDGLLFSSLVVLLIILVKSSIEPLDYSIQIKKSLPASPILKKIYFPFVYGKTNGFAWFILMSLLIVLSNFLFLGYEYRIKDMVVFIKLLANAATYVMTAVLLHRTVLKGKWKLFPLIFSVLIAVLVGFALEIGGYATKWLCFFSISVPICSGYYYSEFSNLLLPAIFLAFITFVLNVSEFAKQVNNYMEAK